MQSIVIYAQKGQTFTNVNVWIASTQSISLTEHMVSASVFRKVGERCRAGRQAG
jgi:hypothetical protein